MKTYLARLEKNSSFWFLLSASLIFFFLRLPSFFEPYWYADEGIYQVIGSAINHGRLLYRDIWDNKPPLIYVLYTIFNSDQMVLRFVSALFGIAAIILFYFVARRLFATPKQRFITTGIFTLLYATPLLEGNIANAESFMIPIILAGALLILYTVHERSKKEPVLLLLTLSGILLGIAFLFKIVAIFDTAAFLIFYLSAQNTKIKIKNLIIEIIPFLGGFALPIIIALLYFALNNALGDFVNSVFFGNITYVNYKNQFIIPQGFLVLKLVLLCGIVATLVTKRKYFSLATLFITLWLTFSLFNVYFSQRPYTHYILVLISSFSLLSGLFFAKKLHPLVPTSIVILIIILIGSTFPVYGNFIPYYGNFLSYITGNRNPEAYQAFFDPVTPRDYQIAQFLALHLKPEDNVFIWGNNAQLYRLIGKLPPGRYIVAYHITSQNAIGETMRALHRAKPRYIIIISGVGQSPFPLVEYSQRLNINSATIYERKTNSQR